MSWLPLSFGAPLVLAGLLALPLIYWLLRLTPPKPQTEAFPPLKILAKVLRKEETPRSSPWWLALLRLVMAALIILALANPVFNPRERLASEGDALAIVLDNGWASATEWEERVATAEKLINDASSEDKPVVLALTAEPASTEIGPFDAAGALDRLRAAMPRPVPVDRPTAYKRTAEALSRFSAPSVAVLSDGLAAPRDETAFAALLGENRSGLTWIAPEQLGEIGLTFADNSVDAFEVKAVRSEADVSPRSVSVGAFDERGRRIGDTTISFGADETTATGKLNVPFELRNDFASVSIDGQRHAGAIRVLDENAKRRRVGLLSQNEADRAQPLLSPLFYIRKAMGPFADLVEPQSVDLAQAIPQLLQQKPAMIVMADVGVIPEEARALLVDWVEKGGTLVRFAGPRLAAAGDDEVLLPVRIRSGERALGGSMSWTEPQTLTEFPAIGPFAGLSAPAQVTIKRQVLAQPSADIVDRTWASLADGTPLVTGAKRGQGTVALFHITPEATWSNLPISGTFVEMLRRIVQLSRNQGRVDAGAQTDAAGLPPYRMIAANGVLGPPSPEARPLGSAQAEVSIEHPPGLYGGEDGVVAHNLLAANATLASIVRPATTLAVLQASYGFDQSRNLRGPLFLAALVLMALDTLAVMWLGGGFGGRRRAVPVSAALFLIAAGIAFAPLPAAAQEVQANDQQAIEAISTTRIAYVMTGNAHVDEISKAGLEGLTRFLIDKTALEPGEPAAVDIAKDELSFYPLIYWPIDPDSPMPGTEAISRIDAYVRGGGTVLFDTRDQYSSSFDASSVTPATQRLREILSGLNIPALQPVPADHVLTKTFFIVPEFPGRFNGSPLWVESSTNAENRDDRPVRSGDGVSPIMITANDLAGAWAIDAAGNPMMPTVPGDPMQREYALRGGVNIMMYMLTGNYKSDQVHVPDLLERLGQ